MEKAENDTRKNDEIEKSDNEKGKGRPACGCGCFILLSFLLGVCLSLYRSFVPDIKGIGSISLGEVTTNTYNNASTDFMHFDSCTWLATAKTLKTYAVCYESSCYTKGGVAYLMDFLTKKHGGLVIERVTAEEGKLLRQLATNELSTSEQPITDVTNHIKAGEIRHYNPGSRTIPRDVVGYVPGGTFVMENFKKENDKIKREERLRAMYVKGKRLLRNMKRDDERWVLRLMIDECSQDTHGKDNHSPMGAIAEFVYTTFMFGRDLFPTHKRHVAVFEREFESEKETIPNSSARENLNRVSVMLICWDDDLMAENAKESRLCPELSGHAENK